MLTYELTWQISPSLDPLWLQPRWQVEGPEPATLPIGWRDLFFLPSNPRNLKLPERFARLTNDRGLLQWWSSATGGHGSDPVRFVLHSGKGSWQVPWELLLAHVSPRRRPYVSMVRRPEGQAQTQPWSFDRPLRVQIIKGDNSGRVGSMLDLDKEIDGIQGVHKGLEAGARDCVDLLPPLAPIGEDFAQILKDANPKPDVLWFSGHGWAGGPYFYLNGRTGKPYPLDPNMLADALRQSGHVPIYVVFWACETAMPNPNEVDSCDPTKLIARAPAFFEALMSIQVQSVLAMQAPIRDDAAITMARELFRHLAAGAPLDLAVAQSRAVMMAGVTEPKPRQLDWAWPVVWDNGSAPAALQWNLPQHHVAQRQLAARNALRAGLADPRQLDLNIAAPDRGRANVWLKHPRLLVQGDPTLDEYQDVWLRTLHAVQAESNLAVIAVELDTDDRDRSLRKWAEGVLANLELPFSPHHDFRAILMQMTDDPRAAWDRLCRLDDVLIAVCDVAPALWEPWFRDSALACRSPLITFRAATPSDLAGWPIERIDMPAIPDRRLQSIAERARDLVHALSVVGLPLRSSLITWKDTTFGDVPELDEVMVTTAAGKVMSASAAAFYREVMDADQLRQAHEVCLSLLDHRDIRNRLTPALRRLRLTHCLAADRLDFAVKEVDSLLELLREENRPYAALDAFDTVQVHWDKLQKDTLIVVAWANVMVGDIDAGEFWLQRAMPSNDLQRAWIHGLWAEIHKARGAKAEALEDIDRAISTLTARQQPSGIPSDVARRLRAYRQDRARILQYLFYDYRAAANEYDHLLVEWSGTPDAVIDVATVKRNYAECLRALSAGNRQDPAWRRAKDILSDAADDMSGYTQHPLLAELHYERAKVALAEGDCDAARDALKDCIRVARQGRSEMLAAIATARDFWVYRPFDLGRWQSIEADLLPHARHGWAARTVMNGRLRAARRLREAGNNCGAFDLLEKNLQMIEANPAFDAGSDQRRTAHTYAGLALGQPDVDWWSQFKQRYVWSAEWLSANGRSTAADVWAEVE